MTAHDCLLILAHALNGELGLDGGNIVDVWSDEGDEGFTYITDNDDHLAVVVGLVSTAGVRDVTAEVNEGRK
jgi:hypothetical protein